MVRAQSDSNRIHVEKSKDVVVMVSLQKESGSATSDESFISSI